MARVRKYWTPTYCSWDCMRGRCERPANNSFARYGGRGIVVCERWHSFANFLADMGERPLGMTIDRIDNAGNYEPGNCRWATMKEQIRNRDFVKARMNSAKAAQIRTLRAAGDRTLRQIAEMVGVTHAIVRHVCAGRAWIG